jgi:hypothetical protein
MQYLPNQRTQCATCLNDRTFGAKRAAGTNRDGGGNRLEQRDLWLNPAAVHQDRFHRFRDSMALDFRTSVLRHHANDQATDHRHHNHPPSQMVSANAAESCAGIVEKEKVGEEADQLIQDVSDYAGEKADSCRQERDQHDSERGWWRWGQRRHAGCG